MMKSVSTGTAVLAAVGTLAVASSAYGQIVNRTFQLFNHDAGSEAPPDYGLRLDGLLTGDTSDSTTFSFETAVVLLNVATNTSTGDITITIQGTVFGGVDGGTEYIDPQNYEISFVYTEGVEEFQGGWRVVGQNNSGNTGTLTLEGSTDDNDLLTITDSDANAFLFTPTGNTDNEGNTIFYGRGWLTSNSDGSAVSGVQDWKFFGVETDPIPTPGSAALIALAGVMVGTRRRR